MTNEVAAALAKLAIATAGKAPDPAVVVVYLEALDDLDPAAVVAACRALIRTSRFFPSVAEIRDSVRAADPSGFLAFKRKLALEQETHSGEPTSQLPRLSR